MIFLRRVIYLYRNIFFAELSVVWYTRLLAACSSTTSLRTAMLLFKVEIVLTNNNTSHLSLVYIAERASDPLLY